MASAKLGIMLIWTSTNVLSSPFPISATPLISIISFIKQLITRVDVVKDLGFFFSSNLSFAYHCTQLNKKAYQLVGFIKRTCNDFNNIAAIRSLYISLVRRILEYCSVVWSPHHKSYIDKIERVQKKFIRFLFEKGIPLPSW